MIPLLAAIPAALSAVGGAAAGGAAAGGAVGGGLLGGATGLMGGASGLMGGAAEGAAGVDWGSLSDMDFMKEFANVGYDQEKLGEGGQDRFNKFMADDTPASPYASMNVQQDNQRGLSAQGQYQNMSQGVSPQGLMQMAVSGIQRVPNIRPKGLMGKYNG